MDKATIIAIRKVLSNRDKIIAHFEGFKGKLDDLWKAVREANGDDRQYTATSQEVVFAMNLPLAMRIHVMDDFCDWAMTHAKEIIGRNELSENDVEIENYTQRVVERVGDSVFIKFTEELSGIETRIEVSYAELAGMIAAGYNFNKDARLFFTVY